MRSVLAGLGLALVLLAGGRAQAASPLAGNWASTINWDNQASGLYQVMALGANGSIHVRVMNHHGMAFDMFGTYKVDASGKTMHFVWTTYSPKQVCSPVGCTPLRSPYPLGVTYTSGIRFQNANAFVATASDGTSLIWLRTH
jgi:hypothetical protein